jgi:hypothetical protein
MPRQLRLENKWTGLILLKNDVGPGPVNYCWPSSAQSFLFSGPVGTHDPIFVRFKTVYVFGNGGLPFDKTRGYRLICLSAGRLSCCWYINSSPSVAGMIKPLKSEFPLNSIYKFNGTSQETRDVSATKISLFREEISVYCGNHTKPTNTLCGLNAEFWYLKASGAYSNHFAS